MKRMAAILLASVALSGCSIFHVHKMDIEQGNLITPEMVSHLHPGMSESSVTEMMGTPMLINTFRDDRVDYVYTFKPGGGVTSEKYTTLIFRHGKLSEITGNLYSQYIR